MVVSTYYIFPFILWDINCFNWRNCYSSFYLYLILKILFLFKANQSIFIEFNEWLCSGYGSRLKTPGDHISKMFKKALRSIGVDESKHFHSLRHTFAVRRLIQGTSIYDLKLLMGHSSVTTTEVYSNMNLKRVSQDFPTIVSMYVNGMKIGAPMAIMAKMEIGLSQIKLV